MSKSPTLSRPLLGPDEERASFSISTEAYENKSSNFRSSVNIFCTVIGAGVLQLPYGLQQSGWIGVPMFVILFIMATYTAIIIGRMLHQLNLTTYEEIGEAAFGSAGKWAVITQMHLTLVGVATVYCILGGSNLQFLLNYIPKSDGSTASIIDIECLSVAMVVVGVGMGFHVLLKTLHDIGGKLSYFNALMTLTLVLVALIEVGKELPDSNAKYDTLVWDTSLGSAFASFAFSFGAHPVLPSVYVNMQRPRDYTKTVFWTFMGIMAFYLPLTLLGYATFGQDTMSPIYLNVCPPGQHCSYGQSVSVYYMYLASFFIVTLSYPIILNPSECALSRAFGFDVEKDKSLMWPHPPTVLLRIMLVALTVILAIIIPDFGKFLNLVSSLSSSFTAYILPALFYLKLCGHQLSSREKAMNVGVIVFGLIGSFFGTYDAINDIVEDLADFDICGS
eukprot:TRINITY_DN1896_c0_g1::TRINITY_DN1896_c0_g1_i1::g.14035::m.14035 TRINITY_DN1896_c0_g1::TRINITY_DN1896_c0_g1_i1::g.14035  ORF type:complete len:448 (-),score=116.99,sp/F4J1Q9/AVT1I_ARATH/28.05/4e-29,Aa_trans/PF01490.13/3.2e-53,PetM/PF08041.6/1.3e+02,PetM/PF08041.6/0.48,PetM/PF08041.6/9.3e+03 TRINITY_DN1896_c0_g1_i1:281-1624(-)